MTGPIIPSTASPFSCWNARTTCAVCRPKFPSVLRCGPRVTICCCQIARSGSLRIPRRKKRPVRSGWSLFFQAGSEMEVGGNESKGCVPGETGAGVPMIRFPGCVRDVGVPGKAVAFSRAEIRGNEPERPDVVAVRESRSLFRGTAQHPDTIGVPAIRGVFGGHSRRVLCRRRRVGDRGHATRCHARRRK